jgi:hypothetical protein
VKEHPVLVLKDGNGHKLDRTPIHVDGGDAVRWGGDGEVIFQDSPFEEGAGPFKAPSVSHIKRGLPRGKHFPCSATEGEIIVDNP